MTRSKTIPEDVLSPADVKALASACSHRSSTGIRNRALIHLLYRSGLRVSEALALTPADFDPKTGRGSVAGPNGVRSFQIVNGALETIERWCSTRERLARSRSWDPGSAPLFCTLAGTALSSRYVQAMLRRTAGKAGMRKPLHPQGLRDAYAAELLRAGADPVEIQTALGHRNPRSTDRYLQRFERTREGIFHLGEHRDRMQRNQDAAAGDDVNRVLVELLLERGLSLDRLVELLARASAS